MLIKPSWKKLSYALSATIVVGLSGCSWFSSPDPRTMPAPLQPMSNAESSGSVLWRAPVGVGTSYGFAPAVVNDSVYAAAANGMVTRVNLSNGATVWNKNVAKRLSTGVGTDGQTVVVATASGEVIALDANGEEKWRTQATSEVNDVPWVGNGVVIVVAGDYRIQAFNAENGERIWNVQQPGPSLALRAPVRMTTLQDLVMVGMPGGKLLAVEPTIGAVVWEGYVTVPSGSSDLDRVTDVVGIPIVRGDALCAVAYQGHVTCFNSQEGGSTMWQQPVSSIVGMGADQSSLYVPTDRGGLRAYQIQSGEILWRQDIFRNRKLNEPAVTGNTLVVGDFEGQLHLLNTQSGAVTGRVAIGGGAMKAPVQETPQGILVQAGDSSLALIQIR